MAAVLPAHHPWLARDRVHTRDSAAGGETPVATVLPAHHTWLARDRRNTRDSSAKYPKHPWWNTKRLHARRRRTAVRPFRGHTRTKGASRPAHAPTMADAYGRTKAMKAKRKAAAAAAAATKRQRECNESPWANRVDTEGFVFEGEQFINGVTPATLSFGHGPAAGTAASAMNTETGVTSGGADAAPSSPSAVPAKTRRGGLQALSPNSIKRRRNEKARVEREEARAKLAMDRACGEGFKPITRSAVRDVVLVKGVTSFEERGRAEATIRALGEYHKKPVCFYNKAIGKREPDEPRAEISETLLAARCPCTGCKFRTVFNLRRKKQSEWVCTKVEPHTCSQEQQKLVARTQQHNYKAQQLVPAVFAKVKANRCISPEDIVADLQPYVHNPVTADFAGKVKGLAVAMCRKAAGITYGRLRGFAQEVRDRGLGVVDIVVYNGEQMRGALLERAKAEYEDKRQYHNKTPGLSADKVMPPWDDNMVDVSHVKDDEEYLGAWRYRPGVGSKMYTHMQHVTYSDGAHAHGDCRGTFLSTLGLDCNHHQVVLQVTWTILNESTRSWILGPSTSPR